MVQEQKEFHNCQIRNEGRLDADVSVQRTKTKYTPINLVSACGANTSEYDCWGASGKSKMTYCV